MNFNAGHEQKRRIALITTDRTLSAAMAASTARSRGVSVDDVPFAEALANAERLKEFSAVVLDIADGAILDDDQLLISRRAWPNVPLIVLSGEIDQQRARKVVKLQAVDWIEKPVHPREVLSAVLASGGAAATVAKVVTFISASGGAGSTFLALQTAAAVAGGKKASTDVAVLDLDFQKADVGGHINLANEFDIDGIIAEPNRIDPELLETIQVKAKNGVSIYSFRRPEIYVSDKGPRFVFNMLDNISHKHAITLVDLPNRETPWYASVLKNSDLVVVVFELNIPSIRHARTILRRIRSVRGRADNVMFVASKVRRSLFSRNIRHQEVQKKVLDDQPVLTVTRAPEVVEEALDRSIFLDELPRSGRIAKDIRKLAGEIMGRISKV